MQFIEVFRAMVCAMRTPWRLGEFSANRAATFFAVAVLLVTAVNVGATWLTSNDPALAGQTRELTPLMRAEGTTGESMLPQQLFTAVLGGALFTSMVSIAVLAGVMMFMGRFLTNAPLRFSHAVIMTSAASGIVVVRIVLDTSLHLMTHSVRWGLHGGVFVDPTASPHLFAAMQRLSVFGLWEYAVIAIGIARVEHLDSKYGYVIGAVVWVVSTIFFSGATAVASIIAQSL